MAKRLMCIVLSLLMIMSILPAGVVAEETNGLPTTSGAVAAGEYSLTGDVTLTGTLTISGAVTIDLCGHNITGSGSGTVFSVTDGGSLTINDTGGSGTINGKGKLIVSISSDYSDGKEASFTLNGGTLTNGSGAYGGAVSMYGYSANVSFTMNGGLITNCSSTSSSEGGAVYMCENATFTMNGGSISGNSANNGKGGAVYMDGSSAVFTLNGGSVTSNTALDAGAAIYINNGTFTMTSGTLANNYTLNTSNFTDYDVLSNIGASSGAKSISITGGIVSSDCLTYVAEGTNCTENSDGTYSVGNTTTTVYVAQVGDTQYETIASALNAVETGGTVTLLTNISTDIDLNVDKTYTLDLGETTVSGTIKISSGNVTLTNGTASNTSGKAVEVVASGSSSSPTTVTVDTSLTINNCVYGIYISSNNSTSDAGVNVTMNGTITNFTTAGIYVDDNITSCDEDDVITVNGTISGSSGAGVAITGAENVVVNSGASIWAGTGIEVRAGSLNVKGGSIGSNADGVSCGTSETGVVSSGYGIAIIKNSQDLAISVTVSDGTITGVAAVCEKQVVENTTTSTISLNLSGGTYKSPYDCFDPEEYGEDGYPVIISKNLTGFITGGNYLSNVNKHGYVADGYIMSDRPTGSDYYVVTPAVDYVAQNTTTGTTYSTLQSAIDAADSGETVQLLTNISGESTITVDYTKSLTLDLAGFTLDGSITITGGDLTLEDSGENGTVTGGVTVNAKVVFNGSVFLLNGVLYDSYQDDSQDYDGLGLAGAGSFTMNGGTISGGVTVSNYSSFTMTDGTISNTSGSGVTLNNAGTALHDGPLYTITYDDNGIISSVSKISDLNDSANKFTMSGGTITECSTTGNGGGVYVGDFCIFTMSGGTIIGNSAAAGGGVYLAGNSPTFTMTGGAIYGNTATSYAADIYTGYGTATIIAASSMTDLSGYAWYTDESGDRYSETNITTEVTTTTFNDGEPHSLIAISPVATPTLYGRTLTLDGAVGVTFYFDMGELDPDDYTITAVIDEGGTPRTISDITYSNTKVIDGKTYYRYTVYVNANEFNLDIDATLYYQGTSKVATYTTYRVATYCTKAIEGGWAEKALCEALMCYGNYAVDYFASGGLTYSISEHDSTWTDPVSTWDSELSGTDTDAETSGDKPNGIGTISASLNMSATGGVGNWLSGSAISMNFYIEASLGIDGITFKINDEDVAATATSTENLYCVSVQIPASEMSSTDGYTLSISDGENTFTVTYSVYQYIAYTLAQDASSLEDAGEKNELQKRQALVKAMYYFSEAASSYSNWY